MALPRPVRRLLLPVTVGVELVLLIVLAVTAVVGALSVVLDRRQRVLRLALMGAAYIAIELAGLGALLAVWVATPFRGRPATEASNTAVLGWALTRILGAARRTVGFEVVLPEPLPVTALDDDGPLLVLARHGGIGDSYALVWLLTARYHRRPCVVLKEVLLWEPLLDVALSRLGACFLPRSARSAGERERLIASAAAALGAGDALLLFPEGGNWTPGRHRSARLRLLAARQHRAARAAALMDHVLPPRPGGVLACLEARPDIGVVIVAHSGLDKVTSVSLLWANLPFDIPMSVRWWPAATVPCDEAARIEWLTTEWAVVDQWIDARHDGRAV